MYSKWSSLNCDLNQASVSGKVPGGVGRPQKEVYELVVSADDPEFLDKLRHGAEKGLQSMQYMLFKLLMGVDDDFPYLLMSSTGLKVLITHTENALPSEEFLNMLVRPAGNHSVCVFHPFKEPHSKFSLFLSTHLPVQLLLDGERLLPYIFVENKMLNSLAKEHLLNAINVKAT